MALFSGAVSAKIKSRLADLRAIKYVTQLPVGSPVEVIFNNKPCYKITLTVGYSLRCCSVHNKTPLDVEGNVDWSKVSRIQILSIDQDERVK